MHGKRLKAVFLGLILLLLAFIVIFLNNSPFTGYVVDSPEFQDSQEVENQTLEINETIEESEEVVNDIVPELVNNESSVVNVTINITQHQAVLGKPVRWIKTIESTESTDIVVKLPESTEDVQITSQVKSGEAEIAMIAPADTEDSLEITSDENIEVQVTINENIEDQSLGVSGITGAVISENPSLLRSFFFSFVTAFENLVSITGFVVSDFSGEVHADNVKSVEIEYYTEAPYAIETETETSKEILIVGPEDVHYQNVLAFTELPESFNVRSSNGFRLYWQEENTFVDYIASDTDANGIYDYVEWTVPHLSNQTFIIEITNAQHLNVNRTFVSDIFSDVRYLDGNWSEEIPDTHYVRITFERNLTNVNDITVYPRTISGEPRIDIYESGSEEVIASFDSLIDNEYNRVILSGLVDSQDTFDLQILGGSVEFDHIIDPFTETNKPLISFVAPTPANNSNQINATSLYVNVSSSDDSEHSTFLDFNRDLLMWIRFENVNSTGHAFDSSSYANDVFCASSTTCAFNSTSGYLGNGTALFGLSSHFLRTYSSSNNLEPAFGNGVNFTVAFWAYSATVANNEFTVISNRPGSNHPGFYITHNPSTTDRFTFNIRNQTSQLSIVTPTGSAPDNQWNHFAATKNGTNVSIYLNGVIRASDLVYGEFNVSDFVFIGAFNTNSFLWNGSIDEVMVFKRGLDSNEIRSLYNASVTQYIRNFTNLPYARYNFTAYASDTSGNLNQTARTVTLDTDAPDSTAPTVTLLAPVNATNASVQLVYFAANLSDNINITNATLQVWNLTSLVSSNFTIVGIPGPTVVNLSLNLPRDGIYLWNYFAIDNRSNQAYGTNNFTINFTDSPPLININSPRAGILYTFPVLVNASLNEAGNISFSINNGAVNYSMSTQDSINFNYSFSNISGLYNFTFYARDSLGKNTTAISQYVSLTNISANWTTLTPIYDGRIIFVSNSSGNDSWSGYYPVWNGTDGPKRTILNGTALLRNGYPDWILLKRGDTFFNQSFGFISVSGRSKTEPILFSYYGNVSLPRPIIKPEFDSGVAIGGIQVISNITIIGLHFYASTRDPDSPDFVPVDEPATKNDISGLGFTVNGTNFFIEDSMFEFFTNNALQQNVVNITFRRNVIRNNYASNGSHSQCLFTSGFSDLIIEESFFDYCGWNEDLLPESDATIFNHNLYINAPGAPDSNIQPIAIVRNNIITRASSHGIQLRSGGLLEGNFFYKNSISILFGAGTEPVPGGINGTIKDNVITNGRDMINWNGANLQNITRGFAFDIQNVRNLTFSNNIIANHSTGSDPRAISLQMDDFTNNAGNPSIGVYNTTIKDNIIYNWPGMLIDGNSTAPHNVSKNNLFINNTYQDSSNLTGLIYYLNSVFYNQTLINFANNSFYSIGNQSRFFRVVNTYYNITQWASAINDSGSTISQVNFVDPNRNLEKYYISIGGNGSSEAFLDFVARQQRYNWNESYTANAVNAYIRAGFALDPANDTIVPSVSLNNPENLGYVTANLTYFNADHSDNRQLRNTTLNIWNSTSLIGTNFTNITGTSNSTNLSIILPYNGVFIWNYKTFDNSSNSAVASSNYTVIFDSIAPVVTINLPSNTSYEPSSFSFNVSLSENGTARFTLNGGTTNYTMTTLDNRNFNYTLEVSDGSYTFQVYANDTAGNVNNSASIGFSIVTATAQSGTSGSGGSGGGGSAGIIDSFTEPEEETTAPESSEEPSGSGSTFSWESSVNLPEGFFENGYSFVFSPRTRITFDFANETHYIGVLRINPNEVDLEIASTIKRISLNMGENAGVDLNDDNIDDIIVELELIEGTTAKVKILPYSESLIKTNRFADFVKFFQDYLVQIIVGSLILLVIIIILIVSHTHRTVKHIKKTRIENKLR